MKNTDSINGPTQKIIFYLCSSVVASPFYLWRSAKVMLAHGDRARHLRPSAWSVLWSPVHGMIPAVSVTRLLAVCTLT